MGWIPLWNSSSSSPSTAQGDKAWGCGQFIICCLCCCFSPHSEDSFPCSSTGSLSWKQSFINFSNMSPLHGLQFSMNCSSRVPFHRVQSFRNSWGPPWVSQILPPNLHQSGFFSPQVTGPARSLLLQRHLPGHWWAWPWSAAGPSWGSLALALSDIAEASGSF